uniref:Zinc finger protein 106 n=1 Tax=Myripristis murdjan TaxID=586833 RepID=A0A667Z004_9TELE
MGKGRKCILCEMICSSKQEMDEHMRSMLHHRELENLKGRDCGHECKVCQVTVASLTEYAGHISSPSHKQNVDAADQKTAGNDEDEDYFDQALVELIEKRKELIRKEEEAAAAKRAKEEAEQRKQQEFLGSYRQGTWYGNKLSGGRKGEAVADSRPWQHSNQGKSATWHAQEPPNFQNWASGHWAGGGLRSQENWGNSLMGPIPSDQGGRQGDGHHNGEQLNADSDRNSSKTFGSNPKLDKACRWSPYPTTKLFDSVPQKDIHPSPSEKYPKVPTPQKQEKSPDTSISSSRSSNALRGGHQTSSPGPSKQKTEKPSEHTDRKLSLTSGVKAGAPLKKASNKEHEQPKPASQHSALSSKASPIEPLQSRQEQQLSEMLKKAKEKMLGKRDSMDISNDKRMETALHIVEEQQSNHPEDKKVNLTLPPPDSSQFLQSVQVSTSTMESSEPAASGKEDEEEDRKREEKVMGSETPDDTMQATESGQGSESDTSRSGQAQAAAGSTTASLSKLGLPPVLKRDLTKHISSKSKTVSHEPNLNSARRVRNVSESRKGETEKESGLKPTVRQLISSSGSRRNVNWEQVYQEVRKKQEQGKGMPRFGIEMVSYDQEEQSQEEDNIRLLEGFQWEMLMDLPASAAPRKRCLSESSLAPDCSGSSHSLFPPQISMETLHSPKPISAQRSRNNQRLQEGEQMLGQCEAKAQKQLDSIPTGTMKALQRSDSALGDSSSGTELNDSQGTGKKRRAAGDIPSPEMPCLERKNKRRKIKSKRERLQVEQLLAVSLREEELSRSLQTVDSSLIQARAALEAAYLEVQRLMVVKQQVGLSVSYKDSLSGVVQIIEGTSQSTRDSLPPLSDSNTHIALSSGSRRSSETWSVAEPTVGQSVKSCTVSLVRLCLPEARAGKRVRRRKKRGVLRKAQGVEQPESSDSEEEGEATRPRWIRARRRPSGGSHVSTSTPPATVEDEKCDRFMEGDKEEVEEASGPLSPADKPEEAPLEMVELHLVAPDDPVHVSTAEPEESMEVTTACQQPQLDKPQTLACNEVTSTSDMDVSPVVTANEGKLRQGLLIFFCVLCFFLDASDSGEDEMLAEGAFEGHEEAVNAMQIYKGLLYTCSGDRTVKAFDLVSRKCVAVLDDHTSKVNCLLVLTLVGLHHRLYTGSSDKTIRCYSLKTLEFKQQFSLSDRVLCLHSRWKVLYAGLANGTVVTFDLKKNKQLDVFECQGRRAVSCLATMHTAARKFLLVGSYDSTIRVRDASSGLLLHTLEGHTKTVLCMKVVNDLVFSGSSDQTVLAHNVHTGKLVQTYRGHSHAVTEVAILGKVIVTACLDKLVHVCKLQSDVQLQVYGGHTDMVTCMAVYRNMIYTGCYDGSVQAVKLNLMQNYRCWWHGCSLIFGVFEHLQQHLINDHAGKNLQTLKCHWKNCEEFFCSRSSKQV